MRRIVLGNVKVKVIDGLPNREKQMSTVGCGGEGEIKVRQNRKYGFIKKKFL